MGSLVALYYKSKMATLAMLDFWSYANNFGLDGCMSKLGVIIKGIISKCNSWIFIDILWCLIF